VLQSEHSLAVLPELPVLWFFLLLYPIPFLGGIVFTFLAGLGRAVAGGGGDRLLALPSHSDNAVAFATTTAAATAVAAL